MKTIEELTIYAEEFLSLREEAEELTFYVLEELRVDLREVYSYGLI